MLSALWLIFYLLYPFQDVSLFGIVYLKLYYFVFLLILYLSLIFLILQSKEWEILYLVRFYTPFIFLVLWFVLSMEWSVQTGDSIYAVIKYAIYLIIGFLLGTYIYINYRYIALGIFLSAVIIASIYIYTFIEVGGLQLLTKKVSMETIAKIASINVGFGGGRNLLASWLSYSLTFSLPLLFVFYKNFFCRLLLTLLSFIPLTVVFITLSRTSILSIILFIILANLLIKNPIIKRSISVISLAVFLAVLTILLFNPFNIRLFLTNRFTMALEAVSGQTVDYGTLGRLELWKYALKSFGMSPILGTGIGTLYQGLPEIEGVHNYHNIWLQFLAQAGIVGLFLFFIWTIWIFFWILKLRKHLKIQELELLLDILLVNLIIYHFKSLLMFQYFDLEIWSLLGILSGIYVYYNKIKWQNGKKQGSCTNTALQ